MPRANWGVSSQEVDEFDRDSQFKPYTGPIPPDGVYNWRIKVLKYAAATRDKFAQLRIGLSLEPRGDSEEQYRDYFIMTFPPVSEKTAFRYVPFLDGIGVTGREFTKNTITDEEGNIKKIGKWRNSGDEMIAAQLQTGQDQNGDPQKQIGWMGEAVEDFDNDGVEDDDDEDDDDYDDEDE
jgi:hypothetical protein